MATAEERRIKRNQRRRACARRKKERCRGTGCCIICAPGRLSPKEIKAGCTKCAKCRTYFYERAKNYQRNHPEHRNKAYKERRREMIAVANADWVKANRDRRKLTKELNKRIEAGEIKKPDKCDICKLPKKIIAYGAYRKKNGKVDCLKFVCWKCFNKLKNGEIKL